MLDTAKPNIFALFLKYIPLYLTLSLVKKHHNQFF